MLNRILSALAALLAFAAPCFAQLTPLSGSRGISGSVSNASGTLNSYSNSAPFDLSEFSDTRTVGGGGGSAQMRVESSLTSTLWLIEGSAEANAMFASPGTSATASSTVGLSMLVEAGTYLNVYCLSGGSYGGYNSSVHVVGGGLNIHIYGGQNYVTRSESVLVTQTTTIGISASGGGTSSSGFLPRFGYYEVRITATTVPSPGPASLLLAGGLFAARRNRR
jgi:hypothetical protein